MKKMEKFEISDLKSAELRNFKSQVQVPGWWRLRPVRLDVRRFHIKQSIRIKPAAPERRLR